MRRLILCLLVVAACGDNKDKPATDDSGVSDGSGSGSGKLTGCLDQPGLPTAPAGALPCDLVPPGLQP